MVSDISGYKKVPSIWRKQLPSSDWDNHGKQSATIYGSHHIRLCKVGRDQTYKNECGGDFPSRGRSVNKAGGGGTWKQHFVLTKGYALGKELE